VSVRRELIPEGLTLQHFEKIRRRVLEEMRKYPGGSIYLCIEVERMFGLNVRALLAQFLLEHGVRTNGEGFEYAKCPAWLSADDPAPANRADDEDDVTAHNVRRVRLLDMAIQALS